MDSIFYSNIHPEYYKQKPHYDFANKIIHSSAYKKLNPLRTYFDYQPERLSELPTFFGEIPQHSWLYGNLDYSFNKYHRHYQSHDEWYPDRKNKSLGFKQGGFMDPTARNPKGLTFVRENFPRGCVREIRKYHHCKENNEKGECFNQKISIMEVCPDHILEAMREQKKWYLRAKSIDNQTYRRAMTISDFNKGRSVSDLQLKDWSYGTSEKLRADSYWFDDRYNPTVVRHPHRHDTVNFPDKEYKDIFGGNWGQGNLDEREKHALKFWSQKSKAMVEVDEKLEQKNAPKTNEEH
ncbi:unnamed protein product [Moneuplotes crassus]|uniref:Uncharacterized protein n=1 Tax=Euplotes crassus TaxID=5936 RepID=A0A7S3NTG5_EUPCR|nr:unnamed protein product [Moneuplotes crassus]|mmetsp:Transcript_19188/g.18846  ORF Transcript_19188/g.18846 Transcript_19188/m.18846 type:complete len:294 (+) Transcript_19188:1-882(+)|eukprot:CAMPEP_0197003766 /NCGR_PEP_ID=MMETSP1380-20130617/12767_1 /TAXON_ID=5936 /ORGANISM="Euplotes crassus, Strain CT5" /LENGTH=293 /DNA_ID=CAMNT_0042422361 /DNA_START=1 /DNA_END=882 /DNA_ORIENTATION=+